MGFGRSGGNPLHKLDRRSVIGALKATGSTDPDVLYAKKVELGSTNKQLRSVSFVLMGFGVFFTILVITAFFGIPIFLLGLWMWYFTRKNLAVVEGAYTEYLGTLPASASA